MLDNSQRKWCIAGSLFWGALSLIPAVLIYANSQAAQFTQEERVAWLLAPIFTLFGAVIIGGIFGLALHQEILKLRQRRKKSEEAKENSSATQS